MQRLQLRLCPFPYMHEDILNLIVTNTFTSISWCWILDWILITYCSLLWIQQKSIVRAKGYAESKFQTRACKKCVAYNVYVTYYKLNLWNTPDDTQTWSKVVKNKENKCLWSMSSKAYYVTSRICHKRWWYLLYLMGNITLNFGSL